MVTPSLAARATPSLGAERDLLLTDLVAAETVYMLESFYEVPCDQVAAAVRSLVAFDPICVDRALRRSVEVYAAEGRAALHHASCRQTGGGRTEGALDHMSVMWPDGRSGYAWSAFDEFACFEVVASALRGRLHGQGHCRVSAHSRPRRNALGNNDEVSIGRPQVIVPHEFGR